jgi:ankyrin repeat protein
LAAKSACVQALLQAGSPLGVTDVSLRTELHLACMQGAVQIAELLLEYGANINAENEAGNTPLHICASKGFANCASLLLRRGMHPLTYYHHDYDHHHHHPQTSLGTHPHAPPTPDSGCRCGRLLMGICNRL